MQCLLFKDVCHTIASERYPFFLVIYQSSSVYMEMYTFLTIPSVFNLFGITFAWNFNCLTKDDLIEGFNRNGRMVHTYKSIPFFMRKKLSPGVLAFIKLLLPIAAMFRSVISKNIFVISLVLREHDQLCAFLLRTNGLLPFHQKGLKYVSEIDNGRFVVFPGNNLCIW